jgi:hypothetical protein
MCPGLRGDVLGAGACPRPRQSEADLAARRQALLAAFAGPTLIDRTLRTIQVMKRPRWAGPLSQTKKDRSAIDILLRKIPMYIIAPELRTLRERHLSEEAYRLERDALRMWPDFRAYYTSLLPTLTWSGPRTFPN